MALCNCKTINVDIQDKDGNTALHNSIGAKSIEGVKILLGAKANMQIKSFLGTPLKLAIMDDQPEIIRLLIEASANISELNDNNNNWTLLHTAVRWCSMPSLQIILSPISENHIKNLKQSLMTKNNSGKTPYELISDVEEKEKLVREAMIKYGVWK